MHRPGMHHPSKLRSASPRANAQSSPILPPNRLLISQLRTSVVSVTVTSIVNSIFDQRIGAHIQQLYITIDDRFAHAGGGPESGDVLAGLGEAAVDRDVELLEMLADALVKDTAYDRGHITNGPGAKLVDEQTVGRQSGKALRAGAG